MSAGGADPPSAPAPPGADRLRLGIPALPIGTRRIVTSRAYRAALTARVLADDPDRIAIDHLDAAVKDVLQATGLPRGAHVKGPFVTTMGHGWAGRKAVDCSVFIDRATFLDLPDDERADSLMKTWVHESMHGRRPYSSGFAAEWRAYRGFEEGMVEGLTRQLVIEAMGMRPVLASYTFYVEAYRALAVVLDVPVADLWVSLWGLAAGDLGKGFVPTVETVLGRWGRPTLTTRQRLLLDAQARTLFASSNSTRRPDRTMLDSMWRGAVQ